MTKGKNKFQPLTLEEICLIYESLQNRDLVSFTITEESKNKLGSILDNINNSYFGEDIYKTIKEKVTAYMYFIIKDHVFTDGNKRTSVLVFSFACEINNLEINNRYSLDQIAVYIESIKEEDHQKVIKKISDLIIK